ncbi:SDR family oxidoreductase [Nocardiopsis coralliicola]
MGRRIAVTGAASGIGAALVRMLREQGDQPVGIDLAGSDVDADLSTAAGRRAAVDAVLAGGDILDGVAACAGISAQTPLVVRVNFFGVTELLDALRPALARAAAPRATLVASITGAGSLDEALVGACLAGHEEEAAARAAELAEQGAGGLIYPSSKAALARWMRQRSVLPDWAGDGIPLNAVAPGVVRTAMTEGLMDDPKMRAVMDTAVPMPLGGHAGPEVIAEALRWFLAPATTHTTGQVLYVDGGAEATLRGPEAY